MAKFFLTLFSLLLMFSIGVFVVDHFAPETQAPKAIQAWIEKLWSDKEVEVKTKTDLAGTPTDSADSKKAETDPDKLTFAEMLAQKKSPQPTAVKTEDVKASTKTAVPEKSTTQKSKSTTKTSLAKDKASKTPSKKEPTTATQVQAVNAKKPKAATASQPAVTKTSAITSTPSSGWCIQVGAFRTEEEAQRLALDLEKNRYPHFVYQTQINGNTWYRVNIGPFDSPGAAATFKQSRSVGQKFKGAFVKKL